MGNIRFNLLIGIRFFFYLHYLKCVEEVMRLLVMKRKAGSIVNKGKILYLLL